MTKHNQPWGAWQAFNMQTEQYKFACTEATKFRNTHSCKKFSEQLPFLNDICNAKNKSIVNRDQFPVFTWSKWFTKGFNKQKMCADKRTVHKNDKIFELDALMGLTWLSQHSAPYRYKHTWKHWPANSIKHLGATSVAHRFTCCKRPSFYQVS